MKPKVVVYDIETISNFFSYMDVDRDTGEETTFVIHSSRNDLDELVEYLNNENLFMVGFNNLAFDNPVLGWIMVSYRRLSVLSPEQIAKAIYRFVQTEIIGQDKRPAYGTGRKQLDLFLMNHYNNKARNTSLKALQVWMKWENVMDMPIHHSDTITDQMVDKVLEYNRNDILSTLEFYKRCAPAIQLRKDLGKLYKTDFTNTPEASIGERIFMRELSKSLNMPLSELSKLRTHRASIALKDCVFPYIKFNGYEFSDLLKKINIRTITKTKGEFKYSVFYKNFQYDIGTGGVHGSIKAGVYEGDDEYILWDIDVKSFYPNLGIRNNAFPAHLGSKFCETYESLYDRRIDAQKIGDKLLSGALKIALNSVYGKSSSQHSALYDPLYTMKTTISGQLSLLMLSEMIHESLGDVTMLQVNTDGMTMKIRRSDLEKARTVCRKWEEITKLVLEENEYTKLVIRDVNNYAAMDITGKIKYKGEAFEIDKDPHKDPSYRIVRMAISDYYFKGIPVEKTIKEHRDIYDFCGRHKCNPGWEDFYYVYSSSIQSMEKISLGKIARFYPCHKGGQVFKEHKDGRKISLCATSNVMVFNKAFHVEHWEEYGINYKFFFDECRKLIDEVDGKSVGAQLTLQL